MHGSMKYTKLDLHFVLGRRAVDGTPASVFSTAVMVELSDDVLYWWAINDYILKFEA